MNKAGYAGRILRVNLSDGRVGRVPTGIYSDRFVGGRGIAAKLYWDLVPPEARASDPANALIFVNGPLSAFPGFSGSRWQVCTKSPISTPECFSYANLGGHWGAHLKLAGYDGLVVEGASDRPVYLVIRDGLVEIKDAAHLWQKGTIEVRETIKAQLGREMRVVATGPAGDNLVPFASLLADGDASGSSGAGAVMGSKRLKAIAVHGTGRVRAADPERLRELVNQARRLLRLSDDELDQVAPRGSGRKREACFGCSGCKPRISYEAKDGTRGKFMCHGTVFYKARATRYCGGATEVPFLAAKLCDAYGLDSMPVDSIIRWLSDCARLGILDDNQTGLPISKVGSLEFIEVLVRQIAFREGFGAVLARGPAEAAEIVGPSAKELIAEYVAGSEQPIAYDPRTFITTGLLYAMEPRKPIQQLHEVSFVLMDWLRWRNGDQDSYVTSDLFRRIAERFWGSEWAADFSTYQGKALAAKKIQDRQHAKECLILCDFHWPILRSRWSEDCLGDPTLESQLLSAVTGREMDEFGLYAAGERVFNLQRAVLAREGRQGRASDRLSEVFFTVPLTSDTLNPQCWAPGRNGEAFQKTGWMLDRERFEQMKTELYQLRGWDTETGLQTSSQLRKLGLGDVADDLARRGAAVER